MAIAVSRLNVFFVFLFGISAGGDISGYIGTDTPNRAGKLATGFCRGRALNNERSGREERRQGRLCGSKPGPFGSATWSLFPPIPAWRSRRAARKWVLVLIPDHLA
jgi:hypothetical protein